MKKKIVLTGGKFNHIHEGHVWLLEKAKKLGFLVVVLAHDLHNKRDYAVPAKQRKKNFDALKIADKVVIGHKSKFVNVLKKFHPDIIVLGYDQKLPPGTDEFVAKHRTKIARFKKHRDYETRKILKG